MSVLKRTPLFDEHVSLKGKMVDFSGWEMPIQYSGISDEHLTVRNNVGLFDVSHMGEIFVEGKDALAFVDWLVTNDISKLKEHQIVYSLMCYENGGIVDDLLVYKFNDEKFLLVVNASNLDKDYAWVISNRGHSEVNIDNKSASYGQIAIQGQNAQKVLQKICDTDLSEIKFFYFKDNVLLMDSSCIVSRTGYTGEDGFEIYVPKEKTAQLWKKLIEVGKDLGIKPIGLGARDTLRFEATLPLYGNEINKDITPLEAGLGFFVKFDSNFIGKKALTQQKETGLKRKLVGIKLLKKGICRHGYQVLNANNEEIGVITTGYLLPEYDYSIALALIDIKNANMDELVFVKVRNKNIEAQVISKNFMNKKYKK